MFADFKKMMIRGDLYFGFFLLQFPSVVTGGSSQEKGVGKVSISNNETESELLSVGTCCKKLTRSPGFGRHWRLDFRRGKYTT